MLVQVDMFMTGRMVLRLKTGVRASSRDVWVGSEQFTVKSLHSAAVKSHRLFASNLTKHEHGKEFYGLQMYAEDRDVNKHLLDVKITARVNGNIGRSH